MVAQKLRVIQSSEMGFASAVKDRFWSGLKSITAKEEKTDATLRKTIFILTRSDSFRDLTVFDFHSAYIDFREIDKVFIFEIKIMPIAQAPFTLATVSEEILS